MILETIRVRRDGPKGFRVINRSDFDPSVHEVYGDDPAPATAGGGDLPDFDAMTDSELRAYLSERMGTAVHHRVGRTKLMQMARG